ncbi:MAG: glycine cleavage system protein GcvH [Acidimicrobiaceae bacterium]|nr:glycine cleavage system protein GcvH [Acidimicrobiaceae bacterium]MYE96349.1 glycine cleavage system protein GcvH [Acidimicrobiaceae bacterium]MYH43620.1 glycine cleavage system protein GcvH [Acidimicrobiaceae bacterium]MYI52859.1 glycine cleavage system protein GcvH [Acidimicrobiaceae bacterium]MYJ81253.1 glycine cleavage system protein GcvH [Acidimicrobiaceae bacterium]
MNIPEDLRYSTDHEWAAVDGDVARIGITDYAQDALGDVVYVELPQAGDRVDQGEPFGEVESTKSVSELFAPVSGVVSEVNDDLAGAPQRLNEDPYGDGWICTIAFDDAAEFDSLLDADGYRDLTAG